MKVCPQSKDGKHHYIVNGFMALCLICCREVTLGGTTDQWVKVEKDNK